MASQPMLVKWDEAQELIARTENPITQALLRMACTRFVIVQYFEKSATPSTDIDMEHVVKVLREFVSEHAKIRRVLDGEIDDPWSDDER